MEGLTELLGESQAIEAVRHSVRRLLARPKSARRVPALLILGETGTGKGLLGRLIHRHGPRASGPFVDVNCAAIPDALLEAELFGFERGAFTDARQAKPGLFQIAHRGTIFLDEVGLLPQSLQAKLLKVLDDQTVRRLGSTTTEPVDVWIISATNTDLEAAIAGGRFREDLYHRLAVLTVELPPLRERERDVLLLAERFLARACSEYGLPPKRLTLAAEARLLSYPWPGNVRELANVIERVALLADGPVVGADGLELPSTARAPRASPPAPPIRPAPISLNEAIREHLVAALAQTGWNISRTAALLGISRNTVRARIERFALRGDTEIVPAGRRPASTPAPGPAPVEVQAVAVTPAAVTVAPLAIRWERRRVTFLRAAVVLPDGEEDVGDTSRALTTLVGKLHVFGGRIDQLGVRSIGAVFGLEPVEDAPRRAAHAAMAIQKAAEGGRIDDGKPFQIKVGIHVGPVMVGHFTQSHEIDAEAKRDQWKVLDDLLAPARSGSTLVSGAAAPFLGRRFALAQEIREGETVYQLQGRERKGLGLAGEITGFVGRRQELDLLKSRLTSARAGHGQVVGIMGEAGIGKSRLLYEFRQALRGEAVVFLEGHCVSYGSAVPFLPVLETMRRACRITDADAQETVARKLRVSLQHLGMDPEANLPYLLRFLGCKAGTEAISLAPPESIRDRTFQIVRQMCVSASRQRPLIIAVEDAHWIDSASEALGAMAESLEGVRLLLIVTYRPGYHFALLGRSHVTQIALQPLSADDSLSVLGGLVSPKHLAEPVVQTILSKAEGNPFFLEELAHTIREHEDLATTIAVPDTVEEVLRARIGRLMEPARRLLQTAAVIGKSVPLTVLRAVAELSDEGLGEALGQLRAGDFLYEASAGSEIEYTFRHGLIQEVAYDSLLIPERRILHARIVAAFEQLFPERIADEVERLAQHAHRGELWEKAAAYHRQAGRKAGARSALREAVSSFEKALAALHHVSESPTILELAIDLRLEFRSALLPLGEFGRMVDVLREAEELSERRGDAGRIARVSAYLTDYFRQIGEHDRAVTIGRRALQAADEAGDVSLRVAAGIYLGHAYHDLGQYRQAADLFAKTLAAIGDDSSQERFGLPYVPAAHMRTWLSLCLAELGEFDGALARAQEAVGIADKADHPASMASAHIGVGRAYLRRGQVTQAMPNLQRALKIGRQWNIRILLPMILEALGTAYAVSGQIADALPLLEEALEIHASIRGGAGQSIRWASLSTAHMLAGRATEATRAAVQALEFADKYGERGHRSYALHARASASLQAGDIDTASRMYHEAITLCEELGMRPLCVRCRLGLAILLERSGDRVAADDHRAIAGRELQAMAMSAPPTEIS